MSSRYVKMKKKPKTTLGKAPNEKDSAKVDDISTLWKPIETSVYGLRHALDLFRNATDEVRRLLSYECDIIYECRVCRNLFRSLANFILHKREFCCNKYKDLSADDFFGENTGCLISHDKDDAEEEDQLAADGEEKQKTLSNVLDKLNKKQESALLVEQIMQKEAQEDNNQEDDENNVDNSSKTQENETSDKDCDNNQPQNRLLLETIKCSTAAVFQTITRNLRSTAKDGGIKNEVMEIHSILDKNEAILDKEGKAVNFSKECNLLCSICNQKFLTKKTLTSHVKIKHNASKLVYACPMCKDVFASSWSVFRHLYKVHRRTSAQVRKLRSQIQAKAFHQDQYQEHQNQKKSASTSASHVDEENEWMENFEGDNDLQMCGGCGKRFERKAALHSHSALCSKRIAICNNLSASVSKSSKQDTATGKPTGKQSSVSKEKGSQKRKPNLLRKVTRTDEQNKKQEEEERKEEELEEEKLSKEAEQKKALEEETEPEDTKGADKEEEKREEERTVSKPDEDGEETKEEVEHEACADGNVAEEIVEEDDEMNEIDGDKTTEVEEDACTSSTQMASEAERPQPEEEIDPIAELVEKGEANCRPESVIEIVDDSCSNEVLPLATVNVHQIQLKQEENNDGTSEEQQQELQNELDELKNSIVKTTEESNFSFEVVEVGTSEDSKSVSSDVDVMEKSESDENTIDPPVFATVSDAPNEQQQQQPPMVSFDFVSEEMHVDEEPSLEISEQTALANPIEIQEHVEDETLHRSEKSLVDSSSIELNEIYKIIGVAVMEDSNSSEAVALTTRPSKIYDQDKKDADEEEEAMSTQSGSSVANPEDSLTSISDEMNLLRKEKLFKIIGVSMPPKESPSVIVEPEIVVLDSEDEEEEELKRKAPNVQGPALYCPYNDDNDDDDEAELRALFPTPKNKSRKRKLSNASNASSSSTSSSAGSGQKRMHKSNEYDLTQDNLDEKMAPFVNKSKLVCLNCKRKYEDLEALRSHMALHFNWTRYECKLCSFRCYENVDIHNHVVKEHQVETVEEVEVAIVDIPEWKSSSICSDTFLEVVRNDSRSNNVTDGADNDGNEEENAAQEDELSPLKLSSGDSIEVPNDRETSPEESERRASEVIKMVKKVIFGKDTQKNNNPLAAASGGGNETTSATVNSCEEAISGRESSSSTASSTSAASSSTSPVELNINSRPVRQRTRYVHKDFLYDMGSLKLPKNNNRIATATSTVNAVSGSSAAAMPSSSSSRGGAGVGTVPRASSVCSMNRHSVVQNYDEETNDGVVAGDVVTDPSQHHQVVPKLRLRKRDEMYVRCDEIAE